MNLYEECRLAIIKKDFPTVTDIHGSLVNKKHIVVREKERILYNGPNIWYDEYIKEFKRKMSE